MTDNPIELTCSETLRGLLIKYKDTLTKKQVEDVKELIHKKIEEIKDVKEEISENKSVHRKITT